ALEGKLRTMGSQQAPAQAPAQASAAAAQAPQSTETQPNPQATATAPTPSSPAETQAGIATQASTGAVTVGGGSASAAKALNPDISVIGDFIGAVGGNTPPNLATLQQFPSLQMHESEIGMQAIIDPYARGDFFFSFGENNVS